MISDAQVEEARGAYWDCFMLMPSNALGSQGAAQQELAAMRAALEAAERAAWRPIAEAPDDLDYADLWVVGDNCGWREPNCYRRGEHREWIRSNGLTAANEEITITHFRPLPQPPVT